MSQRIEVVYEKGVFRPLQAVDFEENRRFTVTVDETVAEPITLEEARRILAKIPGSMSDAVHAERDER